MYNFLRIRKLYWILFTSKCKQISAECLFFKGRFNEFVCHIWLSFLKLVKLQHCNNISGSLQIYVATMYISTLLHSQNFKPFAGHISE